MTLPIPKTIKLPRPRAKTIKEAAPYEHDIQAAFIQWCRFSENIQPLLALGFAVPNGGKRTKKTAVAMKKEGQRSGIPDWLLPVPCGLFSGLAIEFKRPKCSTSEAQEDYIAKLVNVGWLVVICTTPEAAIATVKGYLKLGYSGMTVLERLEQSKQL
jgi:hypothetical protein